MTTRQVEPAANGLLLVANWRSDVGYAWWFMERIWIALAEQHARRGGRTHILYPQVRGVSAGIEAAGIQVHELDYADRSKANVARLTELIRREGIEAIYLTDRGALDRLYPELRRAGVRRVIMNDQTPGDRSASGPKRLLKSVVHRLGMYSCDLCIAPSEFVLQRCLDVYALPREKCVLIPNGIEPIAVEAADPGYARREFGIPANSTVVVSLSRAVHYKGLGFMIECAERLVADEGRTDLYFIHCGDGPDLETFREQVRTAGLEGRYFLPGARPDYRKILPSSDIALHASAGEGFSLAVLECMSAGLGLVMPDNSGNREAATDGESALFFAPGDLEAATRRLRELMDDAGLRRRLGDAARARVLERFTLEQTLRGFQEAVGRCLYGQSVAA
jgi:glycosyltransferase involved in cell wall biosynthesis